MSQFSNEKDDQVLKAFLELLQDELDFTLFFEGSKELPNLSKVVGIEDIEQQILVETRRPLPDNIRKGDQILASFEALGQRWRAKLKFTERADHLHYVFCLPKTFEKAIAKEKTLPSLLKRVPFKAKRKSKSITQADSEPDDNVVKAFTELLKNGDEFALDIEGSKGLPHSPYILSLDADAMQVVLRLHRPMPVQLREGTVCKVSIGALGKFWKARLLYRGRVDYLQYLFDLPKSLEKAGRREYRRYPFRPRENITVFVQDAGLNCFGADGPLVDLSAGGMVFRPDRAFRMEDKARLALDTSLFYKGKSFPLIRISGLHGVTGPIKLRGEVAHVTERGEAIFVAFAFGTMNYSVETTLVQLLGSRKKNRLRFLFHTYLLRQF
ncbi:MAG: PilZ domain-containing protein [Holophagaceae bacterium]|nr:PilZ domain-containing protein [Holophagaceae bacterium]